MSILSLSDIHENFGFFITAALSIYKTEDSNP